MTRLRRVTTAELSEAELEALRRMVVEAFGGRFDDHDWDHTLGGVHVLVVEDDGVVAHGAVVPRTMVAGGRALRTGYVEGVATRGDRRGLGLATLVMEEAGRVVGRVRAGGAERRDRDPRVLPAAGVGDLAGADLGGGAGGAAADRRGGRERAGAAHGGHRRARPGRPDHL